MRGNRKAISAALLGSATLIAFGDTGVAWAQDETPGAAAAPASEIVVTGSRIVRRDYSSESPLTTLSKDNLQDTSEISLERALSNLPQLGSSANQLTSSSDTQATPTSSPGIATINLRGLGSNRTLVLLDGRRAQPANASLAVDLNTIPAAAVESVEVITGGAASTYGADAVAGVVNFKLKRDYSGLTLDGRFGQTFHGDGTQFQLSALMGSNFADDRGNAMIGVSYSQRNAIYRDDRDFFRAAYTDPGVAGDFTPQFPYYVGTSTQAAYDSVFGLKGYVPGDVVKGKNLYFNQAGTTADATLFSVTHGAVSGKPAPGYTGPFAPYAKLLNNNDLTTNTTTAQLSLPLKRLSAFAAAHYTLTDNIEAYAQIRFDHSSVETAYAPPVAINAYGLTIPYDAAHPVPTELATILNARTTPNAPWTLNWPLTFLGPTGLSTKTNTYEALAGLRGHLGFGDWTYDLYGSHGSTEILTKYNNFVDQLALQTLIALPNYGVVKDPATGVLTNFRTGRSASCQTGINPFLNTPIAEDCKDILRADAMSTTQIRQDQVELNLQGKLFELPAGEVRAAFGADWRNDDFRFDPTGALRTTNITSSIIGGFGTTPTHGSIAVAEVYGELLVPVLENAPLAKSLELNLGYRYSDYYNTGAGGVSTWKATTNWKVTDWLALRGGYQVASRAPNVAELFQPPTFVTAPWPEHDPCSILTIAPWGNVAGNPDRAKVQALCTTLAGGFPIDSSYVGNQPTFFPLGRDGQQGNPNLSTETAHTWTVGGVISSPFESGPLSNFDLSIDYYNISISGAIAVQGTQAVYQECFNATGNNPTFDPNYSFCKQIIRSNTNGFWLATMANYANLGEISTAGFDAQLDWKSDFPSFIHASGGLFANVYFNYLEKYDVQNQAGGVVLHYANSSTASTIGQGPGQSSQFRWKLYTKVGVEVGPARATLSWRHLPQTRNVALVTTPTSKALPTPAYDKFDFSLNWKIGDMFELRGGIDNLFDKQPPRVGVIPGTTTAAGVTDLGSYDAEGRQFYLGITAQF